jgi:hypothetical protein
MRIVEPGTFMTDVYIGEMFQNFFLDPRIRWFAGLDFTKLYPEELDEIKKVIWEKWNHCDMGFRPCHFITIQALAWLEKKIFGDRNDLENVFHWDSLKMNLPGSAKYHPIKPWVYKERECHGNIAADCLVYVDDLRPTVPSEEDFWRSTRWVGCQLNHHGLQDAARKRRPVAQDDGPWEETVVNTKNDRVLVMVTEKRLIKT